MSLPSKVKKSTKRLTEPKSLWKGPEEDGVTYSMLCRFLNCRERFRLKVMEGYEPHDRFSHRLGYGNMWHTCEESFDAGKNWRISLQEYCRELARQYPTDGDQINHWYNVCAKQFPSYIEYWKSHPDNKNRTALFQERVFSVPYRLPSGRTVRLRGKFDSVELLADGRKKSIWLKENKSKGDIDSELLKKQLTFDLQTMIYVIALENDNTLELPDYPVEGVLYNVIRRPLSGGLHSIRQHKPSKSNPMGETAEEFYNRLGGLISEECKAAKRENRDCHYFMRWKVPIAADDIDKFEKTCLHGLLEDLCDWWEHITGANPRTGAHYRFPYGVYNVLTEGGATEYDEYLDNGSLVGLVRTDKLFKELTSA